MTLKNHGQRDAQQRRGTHRRSENHRIGRIVDQRQSILDNRATPEWFTLRQGEGVVVVSELDRQQSRAISGVPGLSEIPGLNNVTGNDLQKSNSTIAHRHDASRDFADPRLPATRP